MGEHIGENQIEENENNNMLSRIKQEKIDILGRYYYLSWLTLKIRKMIFIADSFCQSFMHNQHRQAASAVTAGAVDITFCNLSI